MRREWLIAIGKSDQSMLIIQQRVCSKHFLDNDFQYKGCLKCIKENVIPSLNVPSSTTLSIKRTGIQVEPILSASTEVEVATEKHSADLFQPSVSGISSFQLPRMLSSHSSSSDDTGIKRM